MELVCSTESHEHTYSMGYATTQSSSFLDHSRKRRDDRTFQYNSDDEEEEISSKRFKTTPSEYYSFSDDQGIEEQSSESEYITPAQPVIRSIWSGSFKVNWSGDGDFIPRRLLEGVFAHVSTRSCHKVHVEASWFQPTLQFDLLPRHPCAWPKSFGESGPSDDDIGVYFFPCGRHEGVYDRLIYDMVRDDLAMRTFVHTAELLVFTSATLPSSFSRFQGKLYLWGVFRHIKVVS